MSSNPNLGALIAIAEAAKNDHDALVRFDREATPDLVARLARRLKRAIELLEDRRNYFDSEDHVCEDAEVAAVIDYDGSPPVAGKEER